MNWLFFIFGIILIGILFLYFSGINEDILFSPDGEGYGYGEGDCDLCDEHMRCVNGECFGAGFYKDSLVLMTSEPSESYKKISEINSGEMVVGYDFSLDENVLKEVQEVASEVSLNLIKIVFSEGEDIIATDNLFIFTDDGWKKIIGGEEPLRVGDIIFGDVEKEVVDIIILNEALEVYYLKVDGDRYFIDDPIMVSNSPCVADCSGKECGEDGCGGICGECSSNYTCSDEGECVSNCSLDICLNYDCGSWDNGCGGTLDCGSCLEGSCSSNGKCVVKESCVPDCSGKDCGSDRCGGSCGSCYRGESCENSKCVKKGSGGVLSNEELPESSESEGEESSGVPWGKYLLIFGVVMLVLFLVGVVGFLIFRILKVKKKKGGK